METEGADGNEDTVEGEDNTDLSDLLVLCAAQIEDEGTAEATKDAEEVEVDSSNSRSIGMLEVAALAGRK